MIPLLLLLFLPPTLQQQPYPAFPNFSNQYSLTSSQPVAPQPYGQIPYGSSSSGSASKCVRVYNDCTMTNIFPFERRSAVTQAQCENLCRNGAGTGITCRSFVFNRQSGYCDLYAVVGTQYPARLAQSPGNDYYELIPNCYTTAPPSTGYGSGGYTTYTTLPPSTGYGSGGGTSSTDSCSPQVSRYVKIDQFGLNSNPTGTFSENLIQCLNRCSADSACKSFQFTTGNQCQIFAEAAVPTGQGQLLEDFGTAYYEKTCISGLTAANCPQVFERVPQMILVGYAEVVEDASTFQDCLNRCLNSPNLRGITCKSGMFFFELSTQNCILNIEDRSTQPGLFTEETVDVVDYFETGCSSTAFPKGIFRRRETFKERLSGNSIESATGLGHWTSWTECTASGMRHRYRRCVKPNVSLCPAESESCRVRLRQSVLKNLKTYPLKKRVASDQVHLLKSAGREGKTAASPVQLNLTCTSTGCCQLAPGLCSIGINRFASSGGVEWCTNPCL